MSNGHNFGGPAALRLRDSLVALAKENARRDPCPFCDLQILPEDMLRHLVIVHDRRAA